MNTQELLPILQNNLQLAKEQEQFYLHNGPLHKADYWGGKIDTLELIIHLITHA